jgi:hypothetical protein
VLPTIRSTQSGGKQFAERTTVVAQRIARPV